ncbi:MAG: hypothetical protein ACI4E1_00335 [Lachnospira sp.]
MKEVFKDKKTLDNLIAALLNADLSSGDGWDLAMLADAEAELLRATDEPEVKNLYKDIICKINGNIKNDSFVNYMIGKACYKDSEHVDRAVEIAGQLATQGKSESGIFTENNGHVCVCNAYAVYPFYMMYETKNGGKERYNDIIGQIKKLHAESFYERAEKAASDEEALNALIYYAAGLIDVLEVMDQALYEIFGKVREYFKETVKKVLESKKYDDITTVTEYDLLFAYAVLKGCRMKVLLTERYEAFAENIVQKAVVDSDRLSDAPVLYLAAYTYAYSESIKNREYQEYGRAKGGVLWS